MAKKRKPTKDAVEITHRRSDRGKPNRLADLEEVRANYEVARTITSCEARRVSRNGNSPSLSARLLGHLQCTLINPFQARQICDIKTRPRRGLLGDSQGVPA